MLFNSNEFLFLFLPIVFLGYIYLLKFSTHKQTLVWLVLSSLFFYGWWEPAYLLLICLSIIINYTIGKYIHPSSSQFSWKFRKGLLILGIAVNLSSIIWFKYASFFANNIDSLFQTNINLHSIVLPLAISFFTFQQIAYLVDSYRGETHSHDFLHYTLFVTFFPQLIAGPIVNHKEMLPQLLKYQSKLVNYGNLSVGLTLLSIGLFKKIIIADGVAVHANAVFDSAESGYVLTLLEAWTGAIAYTLQLYFDFSGYSDMALGLARMFGICLPLNFYSPYRAGSIIDFWRRWHITLSRFLREYLYYSLGGNKHGLFRRYLNLFITMLLGGLWHGAAWTFVFWGMLHGLYLIINHAWRNVRARLPQSGLVFAKLESWAYHVITFIAVVVGWVYFRAESLEVANSIIMGMSGAHGIALPIEWLHRYPQYSYAFELLHVDFQPLLAVGRTMTPVEDIIALSQGTVTYNAVGPLSALISMTPLLFWVWFAPNTLQFMSQHNPALQSFQGQIVQPRIQIFNWMIGRFWALFAAILAAYSIFGSSNTSQFLYFNF